MFQKQQQLQLLYLQGWPVMVCGSRAGNAQYVHVPGYAIGTGGRSGPTAQPNVMAAVEPGLGNVLQGLVWVQIQKRKLAILCPALLWMPRKKGGS